MLNRCKLFAVAIAALWIAAPARADDKVLNLFAWSDYVPQTVIEGFTTETGVKVTYDTYPSNEDMLAKVLSGAAQYDLVQPSEYTIEAMIKGDVLAPIDHAKIPNLKNLLPAYTNLPHDPGLKYTVPWMSGTVGIVVNTEKVTEPIKGFKDVFQAKYSQRIVALNDPRELVSWVLATQGLPTNDINKKTLAGAKPVLAEWMKLIRVYDSDSPKTSILSGDCDLGVVWSGEAATLWQENKKAGKTKYIYVLPVEGAHLFVDSLAIPKTAPHKDNAMAFMNYILRPEVSKLISDEFPYTNPNAEARKLLDADQLANPASYPPGDPKLDTFHDIGKTMADVQRLVDGLKNAK